MNIYLITLLIISNILIALGIYEIYYILANDLNVLTILILLLDVIIFEGLGGTLLYKTLKIIKGERYK